MKYSKFLAYHPYCSFSGSSSTFLTASGASPRITACDTELSDDALKLWRLGKRAFQQLQEFDSVEHFDRTYCQYQDDIRFYAGLLQDNAHKFVFKNEADEIHTPDFSEIHNGYSILDVWRQVYESSSKDTEHLGAYFILACLQELDDALIALSLDSGAAQSIVSATLAFERVQAISSESVRLQRARSEFSVLGAIERHKRDPKQTDKVFVKECWSEWQAKKNLYKGKASFARDMLQKCENLESTKVIEDWCREWEKQTETGTMPAK